MITPISRKPRLNDGGHLHILLSLLILAAIGGISYAAVRIHDSRTSNGVAQTSAATVPAHIRSQQDVQQAAAALNNDQTATQLDPNQLNADLNSLL